MSKIISECKRIAIAFGCEFRVVGADKLTTFKGGGNACVFYPECVQRFIDVYGALACEICVPFILGGGSDTVIADGLCATPIISTKRLNSIYVDGKTVYAECGAYMRDVTLELRKHNFGGFEFLSGVPATVGGAVRMNASAFGTEMADNVQEIRILTADSAGSVGFKPMTLNRSELDFAYRQGVSDVILGAVFNADNIDSESSKERAKRYLAERTKKQPKYPSCGSVFKNGDEPSGKLIDECGLKGVRKGGAQISEMHGNFIVNRGGATADDFMSLVKLAEDKVLNKFGVRLQREFVYLS